jgi:hypothetical protein
MVKLKLNETYSNDFLTTIRGEAFFKDWQKQKRPEWVEISDDIYNKDSELKSLVQQGTLILKKEEKEIQKTKPEVKKSEIKKEKIDIKFAELSE